MEDTKVQWVIPTCPNKTVKFRVNLSDKYREQVRLMFVKHFATLWGCEVSVYYGDEVNTSSKAFDTIQEVKTNYMDNTGKLLNNIKTEIKSSPFLKAIDVAEYMLEAPDGVTISFSVAINNITLENNTYIVHYETNTKMG